MAVADLQGEPMKSMTINIPKLRTASEANTRGSWIIAYKRKKAQQATVDFAIAGRRWELPEMPATVTLTRIGPRKLDDDNLVISFKHIRDQVAKWYGVDDGSDQYIWAYRQEKGAYGVRIDIHPRACAACGKPDNPGEANVTHDGKPWCGCAPAASNGGGR